MARSEEVNFIFVKRLWSWLKNALLGWDAYELALYHEFAHVNEGAHAIIPNMFGCAQ
jgi:hypothetical protein